MALRGLGILPVAVAFRDLVADVSTVGDEKVLVWKSFGRGRFARGDLVAWSSPTRGGATAVARVRSRAAGVP